MIGYAILLLACSNIVYGVSPDYVGAYRKLNYTNKSFASRLRPMFPEPDINDDIGRRHLSFGILAGVTAAEVKAIYDRSNVTALEIASNNIVYAWSNYNEVSRKSAKLFEDLYANVQPVTDLINSCKGVDSQCNDIIQKKRVDNPNNYLKPTDLLLSIGESADLFKERLNHIDYLTRRNREIPYLLNNVNSRHYREILHQLLRTYEVLRERY